MKTILCAVFFSFALSLLFCLSAIPLLKRMGGQHILVYVKEHEQKEGTPTMGGLAFILAAVIAALVFVRGADRPFWVAIAVGLGYLIVGFLDDFLKKQRGNKMKFDKPIALAADHGGYELKEAIKAHLDELGVAYTDFGTDSTASVDYPDFAAKGCKAVQDGSCALVILCCGTGVGMSMCANKMKGIRACCCSDTFSAEFTRRHNNANALCLGGRVVGAGLGCQIVDAFLNAEFEGGRHQMRIDKMMALENH